MKYSNWSKGLFFIAFACSVSAQGSASFAFGMNNFSQKNEASSGYQIEVSAGQTQNSKADANLTISGENSKVSIEKKGTVTLVAGKSIVLHPGTKISKGSFLYASIGTKEKVGKHHKKVTKLVTVEENNKLLEQASLATAYELFKPFPARNDGHLHAGDAEQGSYFSSSDDICAVAPEQQRKVAVDSHLAFQVSRMQYTLNFNPVPVATGYRPDSMRVLRL